MYIYIYICTYTHIYIHMYINNTRCRSLYGDGCGQASHRSEPQSQGGPSSANTRLRCCYIVIMFVANFAHGGEYPHMLLLYINKYWCFIFILGAHRLLVCVVVILLLLFDLFGGGSSNTRVTRDVTSRLATSRRVASRSHATPRHAT